MLVKRYLAPSEFTTDETWRLVEWCRNLGADEFTIDSHGADAAVAKKARRQFEKVLKPFSRRKETRERMSGRTVDDLTRSTQLWEMLGVLSHEAFGVLSISELESAQLAAAGFPSHESLPRIG